MLRIMEKSPLVLRYEEAQKANGAYQSVRALYCSKGLEALFYKLLEEILLHIDGSTADDFTPYIISKLAEHLAAWEKEHKPTHCAGQWLLHIISAVFSRNKTTSEI